MPSLAYQGNMIPAQTAPFTVTNNTTANYLLFNSSGSNAVVTMTVNSNLEMTAVRTTGVRESVADGGEVRMDGDEVVHLIVRSSGTTNNAWRTDGVVTEHGTPASAGSGHTDARRLAPTLFIATV